MQHFWNLLQDGRKKDLSNIMLDGTFKNINHGVVLLSNRKILFAQHSHQDLIITPLMFACQELEVELVELFLTYDALPNIPNGNGDTAISYIFKKWPIDINSDSGTMKFAIMSEKALRILRLLVKHNAEAHIVVSIPFPQI